MPPALLICCKDFRYIQPIQRFVRGRGVRSYDLKATAGGLCALMDSPAVVRRWIFKDVLLVYRLHGVRRIIIVQHEDCAAYGGAKALGGLAAQRYFQQRQFRRARSLLMRKLAGVRVEGFFAYGAPRVRFTKLG